MPVYVRLPDGSTQRVYMVLVTEETHGRVCIDCGAASPELLSAERHDCGVVEFLKQRRGPGTVIFYPFKVVDYENVYMEGEIPELTIVCQDQDYVPSWRWLGS